MKTAGDERSGRVVSDPAQSPYVPGPSELRPGQCEMSRPDFEAMLSHLQAALPLEGCGLMAGRAGRVSRLYPIANRLASPIAYEMEPSEQVEAILDMEARGWELMAIYHSHPLGPETPSATDVARAYYPEAVQVIVSLLDQERPVARAFRIANGRVEEVLLRVV